MSSSFTMHATPKAKALARDIGGEFRALTIYVEWPFGDNGTLILPRHVTLEQAQALADIINDTLAEPVAVETEAA